MAYKPFKPVKNQNISAEHDRRREIKKNSAADNPIKIFGFRTGAPYKMIPAILYYAFMIFFVGSGIYGEIKYYDFEPVDIVLTVIKYIFLIIMFFSPLIFLSDFKYRDSLPFFKKRETGSTIMGLILVIMFCYMMVNLNIYCMSDTWKQSAENVEFLREERTNNKESTEQTTEEAADDESVTIGESVSYNFDKNILSVQAVVL